MPTWPEARTRRFSAGGTFRPLSIGGHLKQIGQFRRDERGQDLVEYALLMMFVCLAGAAMFLSVGGLTSSIWRIVNTQLAAPNQGG